MLLLPNMAGKVPDTIKAGHATVAIWIPSHPVARTSIAVSGIPADGLDGSVTSFPKVLVHRGTTRTKMWNRHQLLLG